MDVSGTLRSGQPKNCSTPTFMRHVPRNLHRRVPNLWVSGTQCRHLPIWGAPFLGEPLHALQGFRNGGRLQAQVEVRDTGAGEGRGIGGHLCRRTCEDPSGRIVAFLRCPVDRGENDIRKPERRWVALRRDGHFAHLGEGRGQSRGSIDAKLRIRRSLDTKLRRAWPRGGAPACSRRRSRSADVAWQGLGLKHQVVDGDVTTLVFWRGLSKAP